MSYKTRSFRLSDESMSKLKKIREIEKKKVHDTFKKQLGPDYPEPRLSDANIIETLIRQKYLDLLEEGYDL